jgi:hypothetical protein
MNALVKFNANLGGDTGENNSLTRTGIQKALAPFVGKALGFLPGYDPMGNVAHARRTLRALMTIAIQPLISMGAPKEFMRQQLIDALDNALRDHAEEFKQKALTDCKKEKLSGGALHYLNGKGK